jgi:thiol-disulfide isomerase/thioredoxin
MDLKTQLHSSNGTKLLIFTAPYCGQCLKQKQILREYVKDKQDIELIEFDVSKEIDCAREDFYVKHMPTTNLYINGFLVHQFFGLFPVKVLEDKINESV